MKNAEKLRSERIDRKFSDRIARKDGFETRQFNEQSFALRIKPSIFSGSFIFFRTGPGSRGSRRRKKRHEARARTNGRRELNDPNVIPRGTRVGMRKRREPLNLFHPGGRGKFANSRLRPRLRQDLDQTFN